MTLLTILALPIPLWIVLWFIIAHFVADFVLQNDWMAAGKSKEWTPLIVHCFVYTLTIGVMTALLFPHPLLWIIFLGIIFALHVAVDYNTSRLGTILFKSGEKDSRHWFFVVVGFDQVLHYVSLLVAYKFLLWTIGM